MSAIRIAVMVVLGGVGMGRLTRRAETDGVKAVWYGNREVFLEGEAGYAEADKLAHYEDLEEQGLLLELPCKVGDTVYEHYRMTTLDEWEIDEHKITLEDLNKIGRTVFLTRKEAKAKLAELGGKE